MRPPARTLAACPPQAPGLLPTRPLGRNRRTRRHSTRPAVNWRRCGSAPCRPARRSSAAPWLLVVISSTNCPCQNHPLLERPAACAEGRLDSVSLTGLPGETFRKATRRRPGPGRPSPPFQHLHPFCGRSRATTGVPGRGVEALRYDQTHAWVCPCASPWIAPGPDQL